MQRSFDRMARLAVIEEVERLAGRPVFSRDPYVKFLPLILAPPELDWSAAQKCALDAQHRIAIVVYGRDPIAREGWQQFAIVALHSLLHCEGISGFGLDLIVQEDGPMYRQLRPGDLFGEPASAEYARLSRFGIRIQLVSCPLTTATFYERYDGSGITVMRLDADCVAMPGVLSAPCFLFTKPLGCSALNYRHTRRNAFEQMFDPEEGRMASWPTEMRLSAEVFLGQVRDIVQCVAGVVLRPQELRERIQGAIWPSDGVSYVSREAMPMFVEFQRAMHLAHLTPSWDDEVLKLLLACSLGWEVERAQVPVLEYLEYDSSPGHITAIVNFRNARTLGSRLGGQSGFADLDQGDLDYVYRIVQDVHARSRLVQ